MNKPEWKCAASWCKGKSSLRKEMRTVYRCRECGKRYHTGCSGGAPEVECDDCWVKLYGNKEAA